MKALTQLFRVIRYDRRGHGSQRAAALFDVAAFGRDAGDPRRLQHRSKVRTVDGGMVGGSAMRRSLQIIRPPLAYPDPTNWNNRIKAVKEGASRRWPYT